MQKENCPENKTTKDAAGKEGQGNDKASTSDKGRDFKRVEGENKGGKLDGTNAGSKPQDNVKDNTNTKHSGKPEQAAVEGESS